MAETKRILWPIDPLNSELRGEEQIKHFIAGLSKELSLEIQPVYVVSSDYVITSDYFEPIDVTLLKKNMEGECQTYLKKFQDSFETKNTVIIENNFSAKGAEVQACLEYCEKFKPDFVLMNSSGRKGWARAFMGSFTESFLTGSRWPVMVLGSHCEWQGVKVASALMPVEINKTSQKFLEGFLDDHRLDFLEKIHLFHKISLVDIENIAWAPTLYGLVDFSGEDVLAKAKETSEDYLKAFMDHPLSQKRLSYSLSESLTPVSEAILAKADGYDLIVMRSEAGTFEANVLGSVTRDVIREAKTPVVVYPPHFERK